MLGVDAYEDIRRSVSTQYGAGLGENARYLDCCATRERRDLGCPLPTTSTTVLSMYMLCLRGILRSINTVPWYLGCGADTQITMQIDTSIYRTGPDVKKFKKPISIPIRSQSSTRAPFLRWSVFQPQTLKDPLLRLLHRLCPAPFSVLQVNPVIRRRTRPNSAAIKFEVLLVLAVPSQVALERRLGGPPQDRAADRPPRADEDVDPAVKIWVLVRGFCRLELWVLPDD